MKVKYLGHAAFIISSDEGVRIVTDPYTTSPDLTYGEIRTTADIVTVSHSHLDHCNVAAVEGNPQVMRRAEVSTARGIKVRGIKSYHDDEGGKMKGNNIIFCFEVDRIRLCHLGDLGHLLDDKQLREIGSVDILFIPVGGYFTIDAKTATEVCNQLRPGVIIPMHYRTDKGLSVIAGVDEFLRGKDKVKWLDTSHLEFKAGGLPDAGQIIVLKPAL
jgi:L-ascorbate metabolism protein UlaG (beta-lactamase superfamily)